MQAEPPKEAAAAAADAAPAEGASGYREFYDNEEGMAKEKPKQEISNSMRDRLINEAQGLGADPNQKNPFLGVFLAVGVFVVLGALSAGM